MSIFNSIKCFFKKTAFGIMITKCINPPYKIEKKARAKLGPSMAGSSRYFNMATVPKEQFLLNSALRNI
jgi:hypothetical protein